MKLPILNCRLTVWVGLSIQLGRGVTDREMLICTSLTFSCHCGHVMHVRDKPCFVLLSCLVWRTGTHSSVTLATFWYLTWREMPLLEHRHQWDFILRCYACFMAKKVAKFRAWNCSAVVALSRTVVLWTNLWWQFKNFGFIPQPFTSVSYSQQASNHLWTAHFDS